MKSFINETYNFEKCFHGFEFFLNFASFFYVTNVVPKIYFRRSNRS